MIEFSSQFILAADEVWRLQGGSDSNKWRATGGSDPEAVAFQLMAGLGHYGAGAGSKQGIYVCTGEGEFLASVNSNDPKVVLEMMERGLKSWQELPKKEVKQPESAPKPVHRFEWSYPKDGLVLKETFRTLSDSNDPDVAPSRDHNRDHVWFSADEIESIVPGNPVAGQKFDLPDLVYLRLARHHLTSAVRGESRGFGPDEVKGTLSAEVLNVGGGVVRLQLTGKSTAMSNGSRGSLSRPVSIEARLFGYATFDMAKKRFEAFELVAKGVSTYPSRRERPATTRGIGWHFAIPANDSAASRIPPTKIRSYDADWVRFPTRQNRIR